MKALIHMKGINTTHLLLIFIAKSKQSFHELFEFSLDHNLPDSPFASPKATGTYVTAFSGDAEKGGATNNNLITGGTSSLDMAPFKSCYFQVPRYNINADQ